MLQNLDLVKFSVSESRLLAIQSPYSSHQNTPYLVYFCSLDFLFQFFILFFFNECCHRKEGGSILHSLSCDWLMVLPNKNFVYIGFLLLLILMLRLRVIRINIDPPFRIFLISLTVISRKVSIPLALIS